MTFSIIIPSYNQASHIRQTLTNVAALKKAASEHNIKIEVLLFDNESNAVVQQIITEFSLQIDVLEIKKDKGQYDAINKGIAQCKGDYWTWLNTDDYIDIAGFFNLVDVLKSKPEIDYIYGSVKYMDDNGKFLFTNTAKLLTLNSLVNTNPGIYQPGSFFKSSFTKKIGPVSNYRCCFDYEYVLRCFRNHANIYCCDFPVCSFRYYADSKTGSMIPIFIKEQLQISADYGRQTFSYFTIFLNLRLLKHKLFPKK